MFIGLLLGIILSMAWIFMAQLYACIECGDCYRICDFMSIEPVRGDKAEYWHFTYIYMIMFSAAFGLIGFIYGSLSSGDSKSKNPKDSDLLSDRVVIIFCVVGVCVIAYLFFCACIFCSDGLCH